MKKNNEIQEKNKVSRLYEDMLKDITVKITEKVKTTFYRYSMALCAGYDKDTAWFLSVDCPELIFIAQ